MFYRNRKLSQSDPIEQRAKGRHLFPRLPSLGLGLVGILLLLQGRSLPAVALPTNTAPTPTGTTPNSQPPKDSCPTKLNGEIARKLQGQWLSQESGRQTPVMFVFAPEGRLFLLLGQTPAGRAIARPLGYCLHLGALPLQMDIYLEQGGTVPTIFEFAGQDLRLQLEGTGPNKPRPTTFKNATLLQRISESSNLPPGTEVVDLKQQANRARESEAKAYVGAMTRAEQAYYLENNRFAAQIDQLQIGMRPETEQYRYRIVPQPSQSVVVTAQTKHPELHSYTGAVFVIPQDKDDRMVAGICRADRPGTPPPPPPRLVVQSQQAVLRCPPGSHSLDR